MKRRTVKACSLVMLYVTLMTGCQPSRPFFLSSNPNMEVYKGEATDLEYPDVKTIVLPDVEQSPPPYTLSNSEPREIWELSLEEAIQTTMANTKVMRTLGIQAFLPSSLANSGTLGIPDRLLSAPDSVYSVYAPAIIESDPVTGVEGALSVFDAQFSSNTYWARNDRPQNFFIPGFGVRDFEQALGVNETALTKLTPTGAQYGVSVDTTYDWNNNPANLFPSAWFANVEAEFSQPLLQGAGVQFNRIAGPNNVPGFYNGVVIARINQDMSLAELETSLRNMVSEVERAYWGLYFSYRNLDAQIVGRDSALQTWRKVYALFSTGARGGEAEKEAQAREQYFLFRGRVEGALADLYTSENRLRYLMGIGPTDGRLIRPSDEPLTAKVEFDWQACNLEALARAPEVRRAKWNIKKHELQLLAAKNFLLPTLDFDALYRWRGFGDQLVAYGTPNPQFESAWQTLTHEKFQEWQLGLNFQMPLGFRQGMAAVRNAELELARHRALLQDQELELVNLLANAIRDVDRHYTLAQTNFNRRVAAQREVDAVREAYKTETVTLDLLLEAQRRLSEAESSYYDSLSLYNLAIAQVHLRKGSLLEYDGVYMAEGPWVDKAYIDANKRARERGAGIYMNYGYSRPTVISQGPVNQLQNTDVGIPPEQSYERSPNGGVPEPVPAPRPAPRNSLPGEGPSAKVEANLGPLGAYMPSGTPVEEAWPEELEGRRNHLVSRFAEVDSTHPLARASEPPSDYETVSRRSPAGTHRPVASWQGAER